MKIFKLASAIALLFIFSGYAWSQWYPTPKPDTAYGRALEGNGIDISQCAAYYFYRREQPSIADYEYWNELFAQILDHFLMFWGPDKSEDYWRATYAAWMSFDYSELRVQTLSEKHGKLCKSLLVELNPLLVQWRKDTRSND